MDESFDSMPTMGGARDAPDSINSVKTANPATAGTLGLDKATQPPIPNTEYPAPAREAARPSRVGCDPQ
jgi:hypothetical protein